jgi:hypothetical protein
MTHFKAIPVQTCYKPWWLGLMLPEFLNNQQMKLLRLSGQCTGRLYPPPRIYSLHSFLLGAESNLGQQYGRKVYVNDNIRNRIRDLLACSTVPQLTAPPRAPDIIKFSEYIDVILGLLNPGAKKRSYTTRYMFMLIRLINWKVMRCLPR